jgi:hypothetical protein
MVMKKQPEKDDSVILKQMHFNVVPVDNCFPVARALRVLDQP